MQPKKRPAEQDPYMGAGSYRSAGYNGAQSVGLPVDRAHAQRALLLNRHTKISHTKRFRVRGQIFPPSYSDQQRDT